MTEPFPFTGDSGVKLVLENAQSPLEIFQAFFHSELLDQIAIETNKYIAKVCDEKRKKVKMKRKSRHYGEMLNVCIPLVAAFIRNCEKPSIS